MVIQQGPAALLHSVPISLQPSTPRPADCQDPSTAFAHLYTSGRWVIIDVGAWNDESSPPAANYILTIIIILHYPANLAPSTSCCSLPSHVP